MNTIGLSMCVFIILFYFFYRDMILIYVAGNGDLITDAHDDFVPCSHDIGTRNSTPTYYIQPARAEEIK